MPIPRLTISPEEVEAFSQKWGLKEFSLFGSVLRDDFSPDSDVDVLISFLPGHSMSLESFIEMQEELQLLFGRKVDLVEKRLVRNPFRRHEILTTRRFLYAA